MHYVTLQQLSVLLPLSQGSTASAVISAHNPIAGPPQTQNAAFDNIKNQKQFCIPLRLYILYLNLNCLILCIKLLQQLIMYYRNTFS